MEFKDIIRTRHAVRQYTDQVVSEETIQQLLEMIGLSVSALNLQPWKIKVVADLETRDKLFPATFGMTAEQKLQWSQSQVYIALGNALNGAHSLGLGACPMTAFKPDDFARILELPSTLVPTVMVSIGYAADQPAPKLRHPIGDLVV